MKSILTKEFRYTPAAQTDIRATFKRLRKEQREQDRKAVAERLEKIARTVTPFRGRP